MSELFNFDLNNKSEKFLIGTDEAGRGPLAGPVVSAAVCFPELNNSIIEKLALLNDSKKLSAKQRDFLYELIKEHSVYSIKVIDVEEIEKINILKAALKGMLLSCEEVAIKLNKKAEVFVDGKIKIPHLQFKQTTIVKGDGKSASIAAASILAKVYRDKLMIEFAEKFPQYDWANNKGYGTQKHIEAIKAYGTTPLHRKSFLKNIIQKEEKTQLALDFSNIE